ncbi:helix-turn-helix domain-containing protein [Vibrio alginolyticus]|uniref:helix-turn-helix domain-containing protein n=1 Tax=Vibrio alginolyticus TaxID=663 RepID=UPI00215E3FEC|nr:helix-turn-helix domain-containing protein [Vibrio alginolyticus]MCS0291721.1 helix-turn-helix domain-containing protein [Vibrio alginolyticus]HCG8269702.1 helix-turn-helix domain-containing protein [Vibrio parahaemolyticus]
MELLRINDACHVTGLSRKTLYRYMDKGILEYREIDGKRYISLSDLKSTQLTKKQKRRKDTTSDTNLEINALREEIKLLKNSILELNETIRQVMLVQIGNTPTPKDSVSGAKSDTHTNLTSKERLSGDNERRAEEAKNRVFNALNKLLEANSLPMYRGKISPSGVQRETGIDRGTISKYLEEWTELNDY